MLYFLQCANDYGGPRKEFFRLVMLSIKEKYFDKGIREHLADDYETVGILMGLSIVQNGTIPQFLDQELMEQIFNEASPQPCILHLRNGLAKLGIYLVILFSFSLLTIVLSD